MTVLPVRLHEAEWLARFCHAAPLLPLGLGTFVRPFSDAADGKSPLTAGADNGGVSPAHVLAPPRPPMMRAHQPALPLAIRAVP